MSEIKKTDTAQTEKKDVEYKVPRRLKPTDPKRTLMRLFSYFKFNKFLFVGGILFIIMSSVGEIAITGMLSPIIDTLVGNFDKAVFIKYLVIMGIIVLMVVLTQYLGNLSQNNH